jgi:hypothetical protein
LRLDDPTPFHDEIRIVSANFAVVIWMSEWSSKDTIQRIIDDLRRYFPIRISDNDILNKMSYIERIRFCGIRLPKDLSTSFLNVE